MPLDVRILSVGQGTLPTMGDVGEWVDRLAESAVMATDAGLREAGMVPPPSVHVLVAGLDPPYVGYLTCRQFYRGADAAAAVASMGLLGSMLGASRLVVTWENADLCTALELPGDDGFPAGVMAVDADRNGHVLRWHPMRMHPGPLSRAGAQTIAPEWGPRDRTRSAALPVPVANLLAIWREPRAWPDTDVISMYARMEVGGYSMRWVQRPADEPRQPSWMRLLAPVM